MILGRVTQVERPRKTHIVRFVGKTIATLDPWSKGQAMSTFVEIALSCASLFWSRSNVVEVRQNSYSTRF